MKRITIFFFLFSQACCTPVFDWDITFDEPSSSLEQNVNVTSHSQAAQELGITDEFLHQLQSNWEKAVQTEKAKEKENRFRQDFFGNGAGGGGDGGGGGGGDDEEDDEEEGPTTPGPGAAGILTGLFGIFSGVGTLNPKRVIQSTVNFFPPGQRVAAQVALDSAFGINSNNATITTLAPLTDAPPRNRTRTPVPLRNATTIAPLVKNNSTTSKSYSISKSSTSKSTPTSAPLVVVTIAPQVQDEEPVTQKKLLFKETSLLEDFQEAAVKLTPAVTENPDKDADKPRLSDLEKEFANTADIFKISSIKQPQPLLAENEYLPVQNKTDVSSTNNPSEETLITTTEFTNTSTVTV